MYYKDCMVEISYGTNKRQIVFYLEELNSSTVHRVVSRRYLVVESREFLNFCL
jgi:hypothetical protein